MGEMKRKREERGILGSCCGCLLEE